ncbi:MAG: 2,3-bisphosphoglycerate-independent phosphoglycerate mutase [Spirochaetales bacterium]|jgi:2,3-bisphosphoglycerate-independent phosphoglycerate mutase|nr:2,3-bisphosphoglycerate-independent phosphoglycerate mutase [Spirochaetales bacterium]
MKKPVLLAIIDGWGVGDETQTNAVFMAHTPNMDRWQQSYPSTTLLAHNGAVGLPEGQMGNSEVGHLNIGAGRVVYQDFSRINQAVQSGELAQNPQLIHAIDTALANGSALHLLGLLSDGGVHSHIDHLLALIAIAHDKGLGKIYIHCFMDGRDTPPSSGSVYMQQLCEGLADIGAGAVATIGGRFYGMDRDNRWQRVESAWNGLVHGRGFMSSDAPATAVQAAYERGETDEFIKPIVLTRNGKPLGLVQDNDVVFFFNFRADRARELTRAFTEKDFAGFDVHNRPQLAMAVTMTRYDETFGLPVAFPPHQLTHILGEEVSGAGLKQLRIAETEKYAHVTFFFNGGREQPFPGEDRILVDSPQEVATYDEKPSMSCPEVTKQLLAKLDEDIYDVIILNFANADKVGHTGKLAAAIEACETVDENLGFIVDKVQQCGGTVLITADHGNSDLMYDAVQDEPYTAHTLNPVPFILVNDALQSKTLAPGGALKDIAPTILCLLGLDKPTEMEGCCLYECGHCAQPAKT